MRKKPAKTQQATYQVPATNPDQHLLEAAQGTIKDLQRDLDNYNTDIAVLEEFLTREYHYHRLRAEELKLELHRRGIAV